MASFHPFLRFTPLAAALLLVAHLYPGVSVTSFGAAMVAALVIGLLNTLLRPLLVLLTLPVTMLTLGLFLFVINALMFYFAAQVLDGLMVTGFAAALMVKDLGLAQQAAGESGAATPMGARALELYRRFVDGGGAGTDFSGIIGMLRADRGG